MPTFATATEVHVWSAPLDSAGWPPADRLPADERERAAATHRVGPRRRWVAARWALRGVLGNYLERDPATIELRLAGRGKPELADPQPGSPLSFNLSHSGDVALVAVAAGVEVGVDVERIGSRSPDFYAGWTRREAIVKCHGVGLWASAPDSPVAVIGLDAPAGYAAAVAVAGEDPPSPRRFTLEPVALAG